MCNRHLYEYEKTFDRLKDIYVYIITIKNFIFLFSCTIINFFSFAAQYLDYFCVFTAKRLQEKQIVYHPKNLLKLVSFVH